MTSMIALRRRFAVAGATLSLALLSAPAYASGSSMPWETPLNEILESVRLIDVLWLVQESNRIVAALSGPWIRGAGPRGSFSCCAGQAGTVAAIGFQ